MALQLTNKIEVLAPVGDSERLEAALTFGADAIYLGSKIFSMRASPANFDENELINAVKLSHEKGVKVYLTCNTLPRDEEVEHLDDFLKMAKKAQVDALIVTDIGLLCYIKEKYPEFEIHISTQSGIVNSLTANTLYKMGAKRIVVARELDLDQIKRIRDNTPPELDIEAFVHGAMCVSFSGRCLLSNYMVKRDANRGECAQPCRWGYYLMEEKRPNDFYKIFEDEKGTYILNAKDMCMLPYIDELHKAGISSFKIEGRAKSSYYVSVVTNAYKTAVSRYLSNPDDFKLDDWLLEEVYKVSHREYSTGFYFNDNPPDQCLKSGGYIRNFDVVAICEEYDGKNIVASVKNKFNLFDEVEILSPGKKPICYKISELYDEDNFPLETANHPQMKVRIPFTGDVIKGAILRKKLD